MINVTKIINRQKQQWVGKKYKVDLSELIKKEIDGKEYLFCVEPESTIYLDKIITPLLEQSLNSVEEQKMRWGDSSVSFIRPIRWLLLILTINTFQRNIWYRYKIILTAIKIF